MEVVFRVVADLFVLLTVEEDFLIQVDQLSKAELFIAILVLL